MTQQEFEAKYPLIIDWIRKLLSAHAVNARAIASLGFKRLPQYFRSDVLQGAKVVYVDKVPAPPLMALGLGQFADFETMNAAGITYLDTFFSHASMRQDESHHFHELVHVLQWQALGAKRFIAAYADGLQRVDYRHSPLEVMAYTLQRVFDISNTPFDVAAVVREELAELYGMP